MIRLNVFAGAFDKTPRAQDDYEWPELCDELESMAALEAESKTDLLAFTLGTMREPYNVNANVEALTSLAIDVDRVNLNTLAERLDSLDLAAFVYGSPSDDAENAEARRVRVVVPLSAPIDPEFVKHARLGLAELLEIGPGQGVETAIAVSQIMFVGRLSGTPERECYRFDGHVLDVPALLATPLAQQWAKQRTATSTTPRERIGFVEPDERTAALLASIAQHWEAPGEATGRRQVLRALGGYLAKRGWPDEQIAAVARSLPTLRNEAARVGLMLECARYARECPDAAAGWSTLCAWNPDAAAEVESVAKDPREPEGWPGVWSEWWAKVYERRAARAPSVTTNGHEPEADSGAEVFAPAADNAITDDGSGLPLFLRSRNGAVTLMWEGDERGHRPIHNSIVRTRILELGYDQSIVELRDGKGKAVTPDAILEAHGETYVHTAYAFANTITEYDPTGEGSVKIGYPRAALASCFDPQVDTWLRALGGEHYDRLAVWIASCSQQHINRLSACLILIGEKDVGKSMFGLAVARMWGQDPPPLELVVVTFNADLARCPILVDEEAQLFGSKALSTKKFRDVIQARHRSIELKGKERCQLHGALRAVVSCNGYSDLRFSDLGGPAVVGALRDRMLVINALRRTAVCAAALAPMQNAIDREVDLDRIAAHMAWLCESVELPAERFLGSGGDDSEGAILSAHIDESVDLWESFRDWLEADGPGSSLWCEHKGKLCADPAQLAMALENVGRGWDQRQVRKALAPFHVGDCRPDNGARRRLWGLDAPRLAEAMALDLEGVTALEAKLERETPAEGAKPPRRRFGKF